MQLICMLFGLTSQCFTGDPLVSTEDGLRPIEEIKAGDYIWAEDTETGDVLRTKDGQEETVVDVTVKQQEEPVKVYNLTIEDYHTYYVSEDSVLVHNDGCTVNYNGEDVPVYRGGDDFTLNPREIKIDPVTGNVKRTHGVSVNVDPEKLKCFGGAYEIISLPEELAIIQRGRDPGHFEIVPNADMIKSVFQELLNQVKTEKYGD